MFSVGQKLYVVERGFRGRSIEYDVEVAGVGSKWVTISIGRPADRFEKGGRTEHGYWVLDGRGYTPRGMVFLTESDARQYLQTERLRMEFKDRLRDVDVWTLTPSKILEAAKLLGMAMNAD